MNSNVPLASASFLAPTQGAQCATLASRDAPTVPELLGVRISLVNRDA